MKYQIKFMYIYIQDIALENVVWMMAILFRPQYVKVDINHVRLLLPSSHSVGKSNEKLAFSVIKYRHLVIWFGFTHVDIYMRPE